jgi:hypothetical protein
VDIPINKNAPGTWISPWRIGLPRPQERCYGPLAPNCVAVFSRRRSTGRLPAGAGHAVADHELHGDRHGEPECGRRQQDPFPFMNTLALPASPAFSATAVIPSGMPALFL